MAAVRHQPTPVVNLRASSVVSWAVSESRSAVAKSETVILGKLRGSVGNGECAAALRFINIRTCRLWIVLARYLAGSWGLMHDVVPKWLK